VGWLRVARGGAKFFVGKRKMSIARAMIKKGSGKVRINGVPVEIYTPEVARMRIIQTLLLADPISRQYDIDVVVEGGGFMGQAEAASIAIAKAIVGISRSKRLRSLYLNFDRVLLASDPRRTESKKFGGPSARRKKQTSYR
jgi:small subunit ribosomal protein S9